MSTKTIRRNTSQKSELISDLHCYNINPDSRELYLHSVFGDGHEEVGVDFRMCAQFVKNLNFLHHTGKEKPILIHMVTCGGCWDYGMAMYDAIKQCPCAVTILVYAHASSMGSLILQAADYRVMMPSSVFMIHEGTCGIEDTYKGFITSAEQVRKTQIASLDIYIEKVKQSERFSEKSDSYIRKFLQGKMDSKQDWYMDSREAVLNGFADAVLGDKGYEDLDTLLKSEI